MSNIVEMDVLHELPVSYRTMQNINKNNEHGQTMLWAEIRFWHPHTMILAQLIYFNIPNNGLGITDILVCSKNDISRTPPNYGLTATDI